MSLWAKARKLLSASVGVSFVFLVMPAMLNMYQQYKCNPGHSIICDNFNGQTFFKDEHGNALWYRTPPAIDYDNANVYDNRHEGPLHYLRVGMTSAVTDQHAAFAEIGLVEINNYLADFPVTVDSRVEARLRFAPDMQASPAPGTAVGSAGMLFWSYHQGSIDYENHILPPPNDAFGFVWQQAESTPLAGFWISNVADGIPGQFVPLFSVDMSQWHTYVIERRHDTMTYYIDGALIQEQPLNQPDSITLPDDQDLTVDIWRDNMRYNFDPNIFEYIITFEDLTQDSWVDVDYFQVTSLNGGGGGCGGGGCGGGW